MIKLLKKKKIKKIDNTQKFHFLSCINTILWVKLFWVYVLQNFVTLAEWSARVGV